MLQVQSPQGSQIGLHHTTVISCFTATYVHPIVILQSLLNYLIHQFYIGCEQEMIVASYMRSGTFFVQFCVLWIIKIHD